MKTIKLILVMVALLGVQSYAQTAYNPFTQNIHFTPEPTVNGFPCGSVQTVAFTMGLTTEADATQFQNNPLTISICLLGFKFNGPASSVVSGSYASNFSWAYNPFVPSCIIGTQIATLPGTGPDPVFPNPLSSGDIVLSLLVPETSPINSILQVQAQLQVPGYMNQFNSVPDDNESTQTKTYCALKLSGTVFEDKDTINRVSDVNGTPISSPDGVQLYANLIGPDNLVVGSVAIGSNGKYEFANITPNTNYQVVLSTVAGVAGGANPGADLPAIWVNTGEDCCDTIGNDGNANGINIANVTNASKINLNFGIRKPGSTGTLPIILKNFFVSEYNCSGLLSWTTSQESNTSHVEIYRKDNSGNSFRKIGTVQSAGESQTEKIYSYLDKEVSSGTTYEYQLRFVDINGDYTTSTIKTLALDCSKASTSVNIFPNPAITELNVLYVTEEAQVELQVEIMDITGRSVLSNAKEMQNGANVMTFDVSSLASGTYILHYADADGLTVGSVKFLKQ